MAEEMNVSNSSKDGKNSFQGAVSVPEIFRVLKESATAGVEIYEVWLDGLHNLTEENFMLLRKVADGAKADSESILNATSQMYENLSDRISKAARDMPFEAAIGQTVQAIRKSTDFKKNGYVMKALLQPGIDMGIFMANMFKTSCSSLSDMISGQRPEMQS